MYVGVEGTGDEEEDIEDSKYPTLQRRVGILLNPLHSKQADNR